MKAKRLMNLINMAGAIAIVSSAAFAQTPGGAAAALPYDSPTAVSGIESVCTGTGESDENAARWAAYPVKVVLAGTGGQYVAGATVSVGKGGKSLVSVSCSGPWLLFRLAPGRYDISATLNGEVKTGTVFAPATGQGEVIIRFLDQGGTIAPPGTTPSP